MAAFGESAPYRAPHYRRQNWIDLASRKVMIRASAPQRMHSLEVPRSARGVEQPLQADAVERVFCCIYYQQITAAYP